MTKKLLFAIATLLVTGASFAQFSITPNPSNGRGSKDGIIKCDGKIKNNSTTDSMFTWIRFQNLPSGWTSQICDPITCWSDAVDSSTFELKTGDSNILYMQFNPNTNYGSTTAKIYIYAVGKRSMGDTIYYNAETWAVSSRAVSSKELSFYPNPAQTEINFRYDAKNPVRGEIYNIIGNKVKSFSHNTFITSVNIEDLPKGMYIVRMYDGNKTITKSFNKN
ncbi:MAG: T9SS type A sorting domain-containing protein [Bacteroidia bacterium]|nr:T9SS type A sorting domain-containing protein [Bacteroidia bacterium]MBP7260094.1 T9SS type A sorting domain-containing protein [Bacteroidia bacterium]MBP9180673.1 T9SS type A sorting domain-containing protein [Bacteroidia bacterium]MBP9723608.1 T9SS type A sorting domain-containing protein [Bacteroidia bacterium]